MNQLNSKLSKLNIKDINCYIYNTILVKFIKGMNYTIDTNLMQ
jgi:hypothetical protein